MIQIKHRFSGSILFEKDTTSLRLCVEAAVKARADLGRAYLRGADLGGADLGRAYLRGADLGGADLGGADLWEAKNIIFIPGVACLHGWGVVITPTHMGIGCEWHSLEDWAGFDDRRIIAMDRNALKFWRRHKDWLLGAAATLQETQEKAA